MRTKETKEVFINILKKEIKNAETLQKFYDEKFLPILRKYDGKVFNARFINEVEKAMKAESPYMSIYKENHNREEFTLVMSYRNTPHNYSDCEQLYVLLSCPYDENYYNRVSVEKTEANELGRAWLSNAKKDIAEKKEAIKHYDEFMKVANGLEAIINRFNALPYAFRRNFESYYFFIHC